MAAPSTTTTVTRLPTAAAEPVQQLPRKGRLPKTVASYRKARVAKVCDEYRAQEIQREIDELDEAWWQTLIRMERIERRLRELGAVPTRLHRKWD